MLDTYTASKLLRADTIDGMNMQLATAARDGWTYVPDSLRELQGGLVGCVTAQVEEVLEAIPPYLVTDALAIADALFAEKKDALHTGGYRLISNAKVEVLPPGQLCASMMVLDAARFRHADADFALAMVRLHKHDAPMAVLIKSSYPLRPSSRSCNWVYQP